MKLSVILPCYNAASTISIQLEALTRQQWSGWWEVIVVNNGSTDDSMAIVESYRDRLPSLHIVNAYDPSRPRLGVPHSYNTGIKAAIGDAFLFCEADDEVGAGWLGAMAEALTEHDFVACQMDYQKLNQPWRLEGFGQGFQTDSLCHLDFPPGLPFASACSFGMKRSVFETVGEMNTILPCSFEADFCWRAQSLGIQLQFVPNAVLHYRLRHTFQGMYSQAKGYGKDLILLRKYYGNAFGRLAPLHKLLEIVVDVPKGLWLLLLMIANMPKAKGHFSMWFWILGLQVGMLQGSLQKLPQMPRAAPTFSALSHAHR
jgi:glycosyltransferase involved in cell wall biosynthesis